MKKFMIMMALLFVAGTSVNVMAQDNAGRGERMKQMQKERAERLAKDMKLEKEQVEKFVALYTEYQSALAALRTNTPAEPRSRNIKKMTDAQADSVVLAGFARTEKELAIKKEYYSKMKSDFTPAQLVQVFAPQRNDGQRMQRNRNFNGGGRDGGFGGGFDRPAGGGFGGDF